MSNFLMYPVSKKETTTSIRETRLMLRVCPRCPHKASTAQLLLKYSLINPGSAWSVFTFLIYENGDQQGLWSLWFSRVSPGLYNSWLGKAACCSQGRGQGKTPSFHFHSSSLRGMWTFSGPHYSGNLHPGSTVVSCGCCVWLALWKTQNLSCILMTCLEPWARARGCATAAWPPWGQQGPQVLQPCWGLGTVGKANER